MSGAGGDESQALEGPRPGIPVGCQQGAGGPGQGQGLQVGARGRAVPSEAEADVGALWVELCPQKILTPSLSEYVLTWKWGLRI